MSVSQQISKQHEVLPATLVYQKVIDASEILGDDKNDYAYLCLLRLAHRPHTGLL